ncbi:MAG: autotransporter-associated beta strand repeat-containing protein, partial [Anaerolineae bacterium]|nr:autotransporter-associated beta strand repeat-containing protein [Phycisphaerae bacterium]
MKSVHRKFSPNISRPASCAALIFAAGSAISQGLLLGQTIWTNPDGGDWLTASNWSLGLPSPALDAEIGLSGNPFTVSLTATTTIRNLTVASPSATLHLGNNSNLLGVQTLANFGTVLHDGASNRDFVGTFDNHGTLMFGSSGFVTFTNSNLVNRPGAVIDYSQGVMRGTGTWTNHGTVNITSGQFGFGMNGLAFHNNAGGTLNLNAPSSTTIWGPLINDNGGVVNVNTGEFQVRGSGDIRGSLVIQPGKWMTFYDASPFEFNAGATIVNNGSITLYGGTASEVRVNAAIPVSGAGTIQVEGGTLMFGAAGSLPGSRIVLEGGTIAGSTVLSGASNWKWSSGTLATSTLTIGEDSRLTVAGASNRLLSGVLENNGNIVFESTGALAFQSAHVVNRIGGVIDVIGTRPTGVGSISNSGTANFVGTGRTAAGVMFRNAGTLNAIGADCVFDGPFINDGGTVNVNTGEFQLSGGGNSSGAFVIQPNKWMTFYLANTFDFNGGSITNNGSIQLYAGSLEPTINVNAVVPMSGSGTLSVEGGTLNFNSGGALPGANLVLEGGTIATASALGLSVVASDGTVLLRDGVLTNGKLAGTWNISGTAVVEASNVTIPATSGTLSLIGSGLNCSAFGSLHSNAGTLTLDSRDWSFTSSGSFSNTNLFTRSGSGSTNVPVPFGNSGTVAVTGGTMRMLGGVSNLSGGTLAGGTWIVGDGANTAANLDFNGASIATNAANVTLNGTNATFAALDSLSVNAGTFTLSGGRSFSSAGSLTNSGLIALGTKSNLFVNGPLTLAGGTIQLAAGVADDSTSAARLVLGGDVNVATTTLGSRISAIKPPGSEPLGFVDLGGVDRTFTVADGAASSDLLVTAPIRNGALVKAGAGLMRVEAQSTYGGATTISGGTLQTGILGALPSTSTLHVASPGTLDLAGFNQSIASVSDSGGDGGTINLSGATLTIGGATAGSFSGMISGSGAIVRSGAGGTQTLSGVLAHGAGVRVTSGHLALTNASNTFGGNALISGNAATLSISSDGALGGGTNSIALSGGGALQAAGSFTSARSIAIGTNSSGVIDVTGGNTFTFDGTLSGSGSNTLLNKHGPGILRVTSDNDGYTGNVAVNNGTLTIAAAAGGSMASVGSFAIGVSGALNFDHQDGTGKIAGGGRGGGGGNAAIVLNGGTFTYQGADGVVSSDSFGTLLVNQGASTIRSIAGSGVGSGTELHFGTLTRNAGAT